MDINFTLILQYHNSNIKNIFNNIKPLILYMDDNGIHYVEINCIFIL